MPEGSRDALEIKVLLLEGLADLGKNAAVAELDPIAQWLAGSPARWRNWPSPGSLAARQHRDD